VLARLAAGLTYAARVVEQKQSDESQGVLPSVWLLLSRDSTFAQSPQLQVASRPALLENPKARLWTDDFSALFTVLRWREFLGNAEPDRQGLQGAAHGASRNELIAAQIAGFREALRREPDATVALNNLAFLLATAPEPALRNGAEAVTYAEKACLQTGQTNLATLATLAAAYAEAGRFDDAVTTAQKTCKLATESSNPALLQHNMELLERYRRRQPFHQQPR
jgi:hypothetical protein